MSSIASYDAALIAELNDLLQLDHDADEAYTIALNAVRSPALRDALVARRREHRQHIDELATLIRERGGTALEMPHATAPFKLALQAAGALTMQDAAVLLSLRVVEGQVRDRYGRAARRSHDADVQKAVAHAAADESQHYGWIAEQLEGLGYGERTAIGSIAGVIEALHGALATPVEAAFRHGMRIADESRPRQWWRREAGRAPGGRDPVVPRFIAALAAVEERGDAGWMSTLFAPEATIIDPGLAAPAHGPDGAQAYWRDYRACFNTVRTTVESVTEGPGVATLEWETCGETVSGEQVVYRGVSVVEHRDGLITRYAAFYEPGSERLEGAAES